MAIISIIHNHHRTSFYLWLLYVSGRQSSFVECQEATTVSRSNCESEYRTMANIIVEIIWITQLLRELHYLPSDHPTLLCDNNSSLCLSLSQNPISHKHAKCIDLDYHFVWELVAVGQLYIRFVPTSLQLVYIFTKSRPHHVFKEFRAKQHVVSPPRPRHVLEIGFSNMCNYEKYYHNEILNVFIMKIINTFHI